VSPDTATVEFSACTMDLDNSFCSPSATSLNFNFTNIYSNPSVNETIQKFGFYNSGAGSYKWGNNNPFYVANIVTGTWSNSEYLTYNWSVAKNSSGLIMLKFAPNMALINSCMSTGKTYCEFVTTLYFNPSYCGGDISQGNCNIVGGIAITLKGRVNFLLPKTSLSTNVLDFGNVEVGQTKTLSATLSNTSNQETLNSYGFPLGNDFSSDVDGKNLLVYLNTNKVINYTFKPTQVGKAESKICMLTSMIKIQ
jgi:hypothetical protein